MNVVSDFACSQMFVRRTSAMRILVVDDHEVVRSGICSVLAAEPSLTICGEAIDGRDAVEKAGHCGRT